ncbi:MAG: LysR family transcriptional regulator [Clostridia bacterium]|nr:LysR family transcriptional regulator [Clostridia bacterium]
MELLQLRYFCDAAKTENFSATAKKYGVPPSDISQSIRRLERELGVTLFDRRANRVSLGSAGKRFYERASRALVILEEAAEAARDDGETGEIGILINTNRRIVMRAVERFRPLHPNINFRIKFMETPSPLSGDLVISTKEETLGHFAEELLLTERIALAVPAEEKRRESLSSLSDFREAPFITGSENSPLYRITKSICEREGFSPHVAMQSDDPYYIRKCVELGLGVALVPTVSWRGQFSERIRLIPVEGAERTTYLYHPKEKYLSRGMQAFLAILKEECKKESP